MPLRRRTASAWGDAYAGDPLLGVVRGRDMLGLCRFGDGPQGTQVSRSTAAPRPRARGITLRRGCKRISDAAAMTLEDCAYFCVDERYPMFALGNGSDCVCGYGIVAGGNWFLEAACNTLRSGNATQTCGASDRIYEWMQG